MQRNPMSPGTAPGQMPAPQQQQGMRGGSSAALISVHTPAEPSLRAHGQQRRGVQDDKMHSLAGLKHGNRNAGNIVPALPQDRTIGGGRTATLPGGGVGPSSNAGGRQGRRNRANTDGLFHPEDLNSSALLESSENSELEAMREKLAKYHVKDSRITAVDREGKHVLSEDIDWMREDVNIFQRSSMLPMCIAQCVPESLSLFRQQFRYTDVEDEFLRFDQRGKRIMTLALSTILFLIALIQLVIASSIYLLSAMVTAIVCALCLAHMAYEIFTLVNRRHTPETIKQSVSSVRFREAVHAAFIGAISSLLSLFAYMYEYNLCEKGGPIRSGIQGNDRVNLCPKKYAMASLIVLAAVPLLQRPRCKQFMYLLIINGILTFVSRVFWPHDTLDEVIIKVVVLLVTYTFLFVAHAIRESQRRQFFIDYVISQRQMRTVQNRADALAGFIDSMFHPLLRTRLLAGKTLIDLSESCTVVLLEIANFHQFTFSVLPQEAATTVATLATFAQEQADITGIERVKTVGDRFVGVANLMRETDAHATRCARFALYTYNAVGSSPIFSGRVVLRSSLHTGKCMGGVVGNTHVRYDLYGGAYDGARTLITRCAPSMIVTSAATAENLRNTGDILSQPIVYSTPSGIEMLTAELPGGTQSLFFVLGIAVPIQQQQQMQQPVGIGQNGHTSANSIESDFSIPLMEELEKVGSDFFPSGASMEEKELTLEPLMGDGTGGNPQAVAEPHGTLDDMVGLSPEPILSVEQVSTEPPVDSPPPTIVPPLVQPPSLSSGGVDNDGLPLMSVGSRSEIQSTGSGNTGSEHLRQKEASASELRSQDAMINSSVMVELPNMQNRLQASMLRDLPSASVSQTDSQGWDMSGPMRTDAPVVTASSPRVAQEHAHFSPANHETETYVPDDNPIMDSVIPDFIGESVQETGGTTHIDEGEEEEEMQTVPPSTGGVAPLYPVASEGGVESSSQNDAISAAVSETRSGAFNRHSSDIAGIAAHAAQDLTIRQIVVDDNSRGASLAHLHKRIAVASTLHFHSVDKELAFARYRYANDLLLFGVGFLLVGSLALIHIGVALAFNADIWLPRYFAAIALLATTAAISLPMGYQIALWVKADDAESPPMKTIIALYWASLLMLPLGITLLTPTLGTADYNYVTLPLLNVHMIGLVFRFGLAAHIIACAWVILCSTILIPFCARCFIIVFFGILGAAYCEYIREVDQRSHFRNIFISNGIVRIMEEEERVRLKVFQALLPPAVHSIAANSRLSRTFLTWALSDTAMASIRFDAMTNEATNAFVGGTTADVVKVIEQHSGLAEALVGKHCKVTNIISTFGDQMVLAGPLVQGEEHNPRLAGAEILILLHELSVLSQKLMNNGATAVPKEEAAGPQVRFDAAPRSSFTAVAVVGHATCVLTNNEFPQFEIFGISHNMVRSLLFAAPVGACVATEKLIQFVSSNNDTKTGLIDSGSGGIQQNGSITIGNSSSSSSSQASGHASQVGSFRAPNNKPLSMLHSHRVGFGAAQSWGMRGFGQVRVCSILDVQPPTVSPGSTLNSAANSGTSWIQRASSSGGSRGAQYRPEPVTLPPSS